jgi:alpha-ribazole phosphatase
MLILVRHGRTAHNAAGLLQGRVDPPLDDLGCAQAEAVAGVVHRRIATRVVSSPLRRAAATAAAIAGPDMAVETDERWVELDYGDYDGRPVSDVGLEVWAAWRSDLDFRPPGGESLRELGERVRVACEDLIDAAAESDIVVVSHVSPIKAAVAWALGVDAGVSWRTHLDHASITRIAVGRDGHPLLQTFNETGHLATPGSPRRIEG